LIETFVRGLQIITAFIYVLSLYMGVAECNMSTSKALREKSLITRSKIHCDEDNNYYLLMFSF
jgi:hypothetical protein